MMQHDDPSLRATDHDCGHLCSGKYGDGNHGKWGVYATFVCSVLSLGPPYGSYTFLPNLHPLPKPRIFVSWEVISQDTGLSVLKPKWLATLGRNRGYGRRWLPGRGGEMVVGQQLRSQVPTLLSPRTPGKVPLGTPRRQANDPHPEAAGGRNTPSGQHRAAHNQGLTHGVIQEAHQEPNWQNQTAHP